MPRKGSKPAYKPRREYRYTLKDIAELAGMTRNALNLAKVRGKIDPGDFKSVISLGRVGSGQAKYVIWHGILLNSPSEMGL